MIIIIINTTIITTTTGTHIGLWSPAAAGPGYVFNYSLANLTIASFNIQIFGQAKMANVAVVPILVDILARYDLVVIMVNNVGYKKTLYVHI